MKKNIFPGMFLSLILIVAGSISYTGGAAAAVTPLGRSARVDSFSGANCPALPAPGGNIVNVSSVNQLVNAVNAATQGTTILVADGTYNLNGDYLRFDVPDVTLRSASGNREAVVLDGNYATTEIAQIVASHVTIANLTLRKAYNHPIHVMSTASGDTLNTYIYNVHIIDPGQQAIKINPVPGGHYTDNGIVACSHIELTDAGRSQIRDNCYTGGVDAHQSRGWDIRDNLIEGFWCAQGLSEHAIHAWTGSRDTLVERNMLINNARGVGFGLVTSGTERTYSDHPCPSASGYIDHYGGVVRNNFVSANSSSLFASGSGFDCGICLWNACNARVLNNSVYTNQAADSFSSIEWRFPNANPVIADNLVNFPMHERDGASGTLLSNLSNAQASWFVSAALGDLHLLPAATSAIDQGTSQADVSDDIDGESRLASSAPDIGADEYWRAVHLQATPSSHTIHLNWTVSAPLPDLATGWRIEYTGPTGDIPSPIDLIPLGARSYTLPGMTNYAWYTVTLYLKWGIASSSMVDSVTVMPTDIQLFLTLVER